MAQRPKTDARQADFFGAPTSKAAPPDLHLARKNKSSQKSKLAPPLPDNDRRIERDSLDTLAARLSPAELNELVAALPDVALGHLVIVTVRQLRRRLARNNWDAGKRRSSTPLERAARQLITELGEQGGDDDI
jgi:hypothetical protein